MTLCHEWKYDMDSIKELTVFHEVAQAGSFVGAAKSLGMTASGISKKISRFEDRLGVRLFNRTTRSLSLTEAGIALSTRCETILGSIQSAENVVKDMSTKPRGNLRVAASDAFCNEVIVPFLPLIAKSYPELSVTMIPSDGRIDLLNERVDLAFMFEHPHETSFVVRKLIADPWILCASPQYLKRYGLPSSPSELRNHRCLTIHARGVTRDKWKFIINKQEDIIHVDSVFSGIGLTVKAAALQGLGIARLAHFLVCKDINEERLKPIFLNHMPASNRNIYMVYPNRQYLPIKVRVFIDAFAAYVHANMAVPKKLTEKGL